MQSPQDKTPGPADAALHDLAGNALEWMAGTGRDDDGLRDDWATAGKEWFRAYRGLPPAAAPPAVLPAEGAAARDNLCETGGCSDVARATLGYLGFRCARPLAKEPSP